MTVFYRNMSNKSSVLLVHNVFLLGRMLFYLPDDLGRILLFM